VGENNLNKKTVSGYGGRGDFAALRKEKGHLKGGRGKKPGFGVFFSQKEKPPPVWEKPLRFFRPFSYLLNGIIKRFFSLRGFKISFLAGIFQRKPAGDGFVCFFFSWPDFLPWD